MDGCPWVMRHRRSSYRPPPLSPHADTCPNNNTLAAGSRQLKSGSTRSESIASLSFRTHPFANKLPAFAIMDHVLGLVGKDFVLIAADMKVAHSVLTMKSDQDK